jgi:tetratricopeptide (TPR) repeat protein
VSGAKINPAAAATAPAEQSGRGEAWAGVLMGALLVAAVFAIYANALSGPMILDDQTIISDNPTVHSLWQALRPPHGGYPVSGRPAFNITLAINHALGGERVWGYHLFNVALHATNAVLLFALVRRTLGLAGVARRRAAGVAFAAALLWGVHPLATAAVDYISQRSELLVAAFYLLTLYCVSHGTDQTLTWQIAAVLACAAGMASKEVMASAPLVALLYDRAFVSQSFHEALRRRGAMYGGLAATWAVLAILILRNGATRGASAGFGGSVSPWHYALTQCQALLIYLKLSLWPRPLIFDYGDTVLTRVGQAWPYILGLAVFLVAAAIATRKWRWVGFLAIAWLAILAPTSSVVPVWMQTIGEHRAYLPLAAVVVGAVIATDSLISRASRPPRSIRMVTAIAIALTAAAVLAGLTAARNRDYRTSESIWLDTATKRPTNARAVQTLGNAHFAAGDYPAAIADYTRVARLRPNLASAYNNRASAYLSAGEPERAIADCTEAVYLDPNFAMAYSNRGNAYLALRRYDLAIANFTQALRCDPALAEAYYNRGNAYAYTDQAQPAMDDYTEAIRLRPGFAPPYSNRANLYVQLGRYDLAIADCTRAIELKPDYLDAYTNRLVACLYAGRYDQAWSDVRAIRKLGGAPEPAVVRKLAELSGRSE